MAMRPLGVQELTYLVSISLILSIATTPAYAVSSFTTFTEIIEFNNLFGPFDVFLDLKATKDGETFNPAPPLTLSSWKVRPGNIFSDLVTFSSPNSGTSEQVLWGHFDGDNGGIAPTPNFAGPLLLDFRFPVTQVGFRNLGLQPGMNVQFFNPGGVLLGEVLATPVSFVGASSTVPIGSLKIEGVDGFVSLITELRFNPVPEPSTLLLLGSGIVGIGAVGRRWGRRK